jgi:hypothetical protein
MIGSVQGICDKDGVVPAAFQRMYHCTTERACATMMGTDRAALLQVAVLAARAVDIRIADADNPSGLSWPYVSPVEFLLADTYEGVACVLDADICTQTSAPGRRNAAYKRIAHKMDGACA